MAKKEKYLVKFFKGTFEQYSSITPDAYTFYFLTDIDKIYLGDVQLSNTQIYQRVEYLNDQLEDKANIKIKTKEEWDQDINLISQQNTFYIYTNQITQEDEKGNIINHPGIKIGDGTSYLIDLPFVGDLLYTHINNSNIHISLEDREFWNNKVRTQDSQIDEENLIFTIY